MINGEILKACEGLTWLLKASSLSLPARVSYAIVRNTRGLFSIGLDIEQLRIAICEKYGKLSEADNKYIFDKDKIDIVNKELDDLLNMDTPYDLLKIKIDALDNYDISPEVMDALYFMIEEEDGEG